MRNSISFTFTSLRTQRYACALATAVLFAASPTIAQAQLGRLKKMGADAIKDAAKEKAGLDKKDPTKSGSSASSSSSNAAPVLDDERIALVLASFTPQLKAAQTREAAARAEPVWKEKVKTRDACMDRAKSADPAKMAAAAQKNSAKSTANSKLMSSVQERWAGLMNTNPNDPRLVFLQDSLNFLNLRNIVLTFDLPCVVEPTPFVLLQAEVDKDSDSGRRNGYDPGSAVTQAMSNYEYGLLRERIALWAILQEDPAAKVGKQGTFTPAEQAALAKRAADIKPLTALFKSDALIWKGWSDLKGW